MAGWHHWLDAHEFGWTPGVGDGQGDLACCVRFMGSWRVGHDWVTELNWKAIKIKCRIDSKPFFIPRSKHLLISWLQSPSTVILDPRKIKSATVSIFFPSVCHDGEGNGNPLQYSCLENPMDGGAWWATVHGVAKSWTRLSDFPTSLLPWSDGTGCHDLNFCNVEF